MYINSVPSLANASELTVVAQSMAILLMRNRPLEKSSSKPFLGQILIARERHLGRLILITILPCN